MDTKADTVELSRSPRCYEESGVSIHEYASVLVDLHTRYTLASAALGKYGQRVMAELMEYISLREVSRRSGLSPTYLSMVRNGKASVSVEAFVKLDGVLQDIENSVTSA